MSYLDTIEFNFKDVYKKVTITKNLDKLDQSINENNLFNNLMFVLKNYGNIFIIAFLEKIKNILPKRYIYGISERKEEKKNNTNDYWMCSNNDYLIETIPFLVLMMKNNFFGEVVELFGLDNDYVNRICITYMRYSLYKSKLYDISIHIDGFKNLNISRKTINNIFSHVFFLPRDVTSYDIKIHVLKNMIRLFHRKIKFDEYIYYSDSGINSDILSLMIDNLISKSIRKKSFSKINNLMKHVNNCIARTYSNDANIDNFVEYNFELIKKIKNHKQNDLINNIDSNIIIDFVRGLIYNYYKPIRPNSFEAIKYIYNIEHYKSLVSKIIVEYIVTSFRLSVVNDIDIGYIYGKFKFYKSDDDDDDDGDDIKNTIQQSLFKWAFGQNDIASNIIDMITYNENHNDKHNENENLTCQLCMSETKLKYKKCDHPICKECLKTNYEKLYITKLCVMCNI